MEEQIESLLTSYQIAVTEIRNALKNAGLSDREILEKTANRPDFNNMLPEDVLNYYTEIKVLVILYLSKSIKLSTREIARRLGGTSYVTIHKILELYSSPNDIKRVTLDEVMREGD